MTEHQLIIQDYKFCQFKTADPTLFNSLRKYLSYRALGVEYTAAYQNGWDGVNYLMSKKGIFASGLITKVKTFLTEQSVEYSIDDKRKPIIPNVGIDLTDKLKELNMVPREHQVRIVNACLESNKGIVRAATSSGKTLAIALLTAKLNKPTIIYVIGLDLLKQFHDLFSSLFNEPIGYIGDGVCNIERINIATVWTISRSLKLNKKEIAIEDDDSYEKFNETHSEKIIKMLQQTNVHIIDESHIATTSSIKAIFNTIEPEHIYGFSGTPFRDDNSDLLINGILGEQIINVSASELIEKGIIVQPIIKFVPIPKTPNMSSANYQTVYKECVVENETRNNLIVKHTVGLIEKGYTPLVLFKQIKHGEILLEKMEQEASIKCMMLNGNDSLDERERVKELLKNKQINTILASTIFDIGINIECLSGLVLGGSGKSKLRSTQRIGRIIRAFPNKKFAAIIDFYDQVKFLKKHSQIRYETYCSEPGFKVIKCREMK